MERRCTIRLGEFDDVYLQRGAMQAMAVNAADGLVEITYEEAPHIVAREKLPPAIAVRFVQAIFQRNRLCRVELPAAFREE